MVMLVGQYSTGKTTFIRHLLGKVADASNIEIAEHKVENFNSLFFSRVAGLSRNPDRARAHHGQIHSCDGCKQ